jgi:hypothetical protein
MMIVIMYGVICLVAIVMLMVVRLIPTDDGTLDPAQLALLDNQLKIEQLQERIKELELEEKCQCQ